ncbi:MAG: hypothetical protein Q7S44_01050 [bacterium]|nr:hypothetical protein [bacterium]
MSEVPSNQISPRESVVRHDPLSPADRSALIKRAMVTPNEAEAQADLDKVKLHGSSIEYRQVMANRGVSRLNHPYLPHLRRKLVLAVTGAAILVGDIMITVPIIQQNPKENLLLPAIAFGVGLTSLFLAKSE